MVTRLLCLLTLAAILAAPAAHAHVGDQIYPFFELLDEDLDRIDLTDGSVEDWLEVIGEPSLTASDFLWLNNPYDPSELDFRMWLAWHQGSSTLWIAMERFDDLYFNLYDADKPWEMQLWDSSLRFKVDGDHTGGEYSYFLGWNCAGCSPEQVLESHRQAQEWMAIAETPDGEHLFHIGASEWVASGAVRRSGRRRHRPEPGDLGHRAQGDRLRRPHLRRRGRLRGLPAPPWQDDRVLHIHFRQ